jgi:DsbC/DsbD-like thiol-disulfide interchange protein
MRARHRVSSEYKMTHYRVHLAPRGVGTALQLSGALIALLVGLSVSVMAQTAPVVWTAAPTWTDPVAPGATVTVRLSAKINPGWHLYSITQQPGGPVATRIDLAPGQAFILGGAVDGSTPVTRFDANFNIEVQMYDGSATFTVPVRVTREALPGPATVTVTARYQACNATLCMPPHTDKVTVPLTVSRLD